ncbi:MAG: low molecular weight phosphotyrosine protein phosphatase [Chloroflexi bacterium]|nr:low molecular weight phosphotyrosine protein phosphatase [Chloroflexota bacterium]
MSISVLFVCLGNICRSPMADGIFRKMVDEAGLSDQILVDSAGTGAWHVGEKAHSGTRQILKQHNIPYNGRSRQVTPTDMANQDTYIIVMDQSNMDDLQRQYGTHPRLHKLLQFATNTNKQNVPDPYYVGGFDYAYELVADGCRGLLETIRQQEGL